MLEIFVLALTILAVTGWCLYFDKRDEAKTHRVKEKQAQRVAKAYKTRIRRKLYTGVIESNKPIRGRK